MSKVVLCPECGKLIALSFPIHDCKPKRMKQKLDGVRTLAIKLFEAGQKEKRKQGKEIWGTINTWRDLPSESVAVWDAVAICAYKELRKKSK